MHIAGVGDVPPFSETSLLDGPKRKRSRKASSSSSSMTTPDSDVNAAAADLQNLATSTSFSSGSLTLVMTSTACYIQRTGLNSKWWNRITKSIVLMDEESLRGLQGSISVFSLPLFLCLMVGTISSKYSLDE